MSYDKKSFLAGLAAGLAMKGRYSHSIRPQPPVGQYLRFSSANAFSIATENATKNWDGTLEYSTDSTHWSEWDGTAAISSASLLGTQCLYIRGYNNTHITGQEPGGAPQIAKAWTFTPSDNGVKCDGDIRTLLDYRDPIDTVMGNGCFYRLFANAPLTSSPALPSTSLSYGCYSWMFYKCYQLRTPPALPATVLSDECYSNMFYDCRRLEYAPPLPSVNLAYRCYLGMFRGCDSLKTPPLLPATILSDACYNSMFSRCSSLKSAPRLPATAIAQWCYASMFTDCVSLTSIPELPATILKEYCYYNMFGGCTSLKVSAAQEQATDTPYRIPKSGTGTDANYALNNMFNGTGGTFTGTPAINTTYYTSNQVV